MRICNLGATGQSRRRGYVLVAFVIVLVPLFGAAGLVIDMGMMMTAYRKAQNAADSGALAGGVELSKGNSAGAVAEATYYVVTQSGAVVSTQYPIQVGPRTGPYAGDSNHIEVYATVTVNTLFLHLLGYASSQTVQARAVAGLDFTTFDEGVLLLAKTGSGALTVAGNGSLTVNSGTIVVDSNATSPAAAQSNGNATVTAAAISVTGGYSGNFSPTPVTGVAAMSDPLAYLAAPNPASLTPRTVTGSTLQPGIYTGGISLSGGTTTLAAGIYYMDGGGFQISGQANVTDNGAGVMIYNAPKTSQDVVSISGQGTFNISPIKSGPYQGLTIFQDRTSTNPVTISGNGSSKQIQGTVYAAAAQVSISGNGGLTGAQIVSGTLNVSGNGVDIINFGGNTALTPKVFLVE